MDIFKTRTLAEKARQMYEEGAFERLEAFKKSRKKSWKVLGFNNAEVEKILALPKIAGNEAKLIISDESIAARRGVAKTENQMKMDKHRLRSNPRLANVSMIRYRPRLLHLLMATVSHGVLAVMSEIKEQEKFRADPRFPLMQVMQRNARYQTIFKGPTGKPIFA